MIYLTLFVFAVGMFVLGYEVAADEPVFGRGWFTFMAILMTLNGLRLALALSR